MAFFTSLSYPFRHPPQETAEMRRDIVVCAARAGWVLKTCGAATAILEFEEAGEALSVGSAIAARNGVDLIVEEPGGLQRYVRQSPLLAA